MSKDDDSKTEGDGFSDEAKKLLDAVGDRTREIVHEVLDERLAASSEKSDESEKTEPDPDPVPEIKTSLAARLGF